MNIIIEETTGNTSNLVVGIEEARIKLFPTLVHNGFVLIGGDQIAHYIQLFLTYEYITK